MKTKGLEVRLKIYAQAFSVIYIDAAKGVKEQFTKSSQHQGNFKKN